MQFGSACSMRLTQHRLQSNAKHRTGSYDHDNVAPDQLTLLAHMEMERSGKGALRKGTLSSKTLLSSCMMVGGYCGYDC